MVDQVILSTTGKDIAQQVGSSAAGDKVIILNANGQSVAVPVSPVVAGDKVTIINTPGGPVVFNPAKSGAGGIVESDAVDPCKAFTVIADPSAPSNFLLTWVPGDNNDEVEYDFNVDGGFPVKPKTGEEYATWPTTLDEHGVLKYTTASHHCIRYFAWHYFVIWGKRNGKYSKGVLYATCKVDMTFVLSRLRMYCYTLFSSFPQEYTPSGWEGDMGECWSAGFNLLNWPQGRPEYQCQWIVIDNWYDVYKYNPLKFVVTGSWLPNYGWEYWSDGYLEYNIDSPANGYNRDNHTKGFDLTQAYADAGFGKILQGIFSVEGVPNVPCAYRSGSWFSWVNPPTNPANVNWWIRSDLGSAGVPPGQTQNSGATYFGKGAGSPNPWADLTILFDDGGPANNWGYIIARVTDPDNGILEVWAGVAGTQGVGSTWINFGRYKEIYFGDILLCQNHGALPGATYHGFLGISLLGDLDAP